MYVFNNDTPDEVLHEVKRAVSKLKREADRELARDYLTCREVDIFTAKVEAFNEALEMLERAMVVEF